MAEKDFNKTSDQEEKVLSIDRVTKVVKGGKNMRFRASVVVGDRQGKVGVGISKSAEVPKAIRKAIEAAKKNQIEVLKQSSSIPHDVQGVYESSRVMLKPAKKGTGVIAGGAVRSVLELAGIHDVVGKLRGSNNAINAAKATIDALSKLMNKEKVELLRGIKISTFNTSDNKIEYAGKEYANDVVIAE